MSFDAYQRSKMRLRRYNKGTQTDENGNSNNCHSTSEPLGAPARLCLSLHRMAIPQNKASPALPIALGYLGASVWSMLGWVFFPSFS